MTNEINLDNVSEATMEELVAFYNKRNPFDLKAKFRSLQYGREWVTTRLIDEAAEDGPDAPAEDAPVHAAPAAPEAAPAKPARKRTAKLKVEKEISAAEHVAHGLEEVFAGVKTLVHEQMEKKEKEIIDNTKIDLALTIQAATGMNTLALTGKTETALTFQTTGASDDAPTADETGPTPRQIASDKAVPQREIIKPTTRASNAAGVAASWLIPEVRDARGTRDGVTVEFEGVLTEYKSVKKAFDAFYLPDSKHIRFRGALKAAKVLEFVDDGKKYLFKIAKISDSVQ